MARMDPLPAGARPELAATFAAFERILGVVPNILLMMQRRARIVAAFEALTEAVMDPDGTVDRGLKRLAAHMASRAAGCQYCQAHSLAAAGMSGVGEAKVAGIWDFRTSPLYNDAERAALESPWRPDRSPTAWGDPRRDLPVRLPESLE